MITIKKTIQDPKRGTILEPFFGRDMVILYAPDTKVVDGVYKVIMDTNLIPAGKDKRGIPVFVRRCSVIQKVE